VKLARHRRPKAAGSPIFADCKPKANAAILWDMGHTKGRLCKVGIGQGKETKNLNEVDVLTVKEYRNFKLAGATMGSRLGRGESIGAVIHICMGTT
jgi:hypothetical protein